MTRIIWDAVEDRQYENGVDRGVLFPKSGPGVAWNGLISVSDFFIGGESQSYHFDGIKYYEKVDAKVFQANLSAFSSPVEFLPCMGIKSLIPGFQITRQPKEQFDLSYRTLMNSMDDYKIHLVYNATASPGNRSAASLQDNISPEIRTWKLDCVPVVGVGFKPNAHFTVMSSRVAPDILSQLEDMLYGTESSSPQMPSVEDLLDLIEE